MKINHKWPQKAIRFKKVLNRETLNRCIGRREFAGKSARIAFRRSRKTQAACGKAFDTGCENR